MRILSAAMIAEKNRVQSTHVFTVLFEATIAGAPAPYRLAAYDQDITFHGLTFTHLNQFELDQLEDATSQALGRVRLAVANVGQELSALLENYHPGQVRWDVVVWQIDALQPDETPLASGELFLVAQVTTDFRDAVIDMQAEGLTLSGLMPKRRFTASGGFPNIPRRLS